MHPLCVGAIMGEKRIDCLDGIRGLAIFMVLVWHYFTCQIQPEPGSWLAKLKLVSSLTWSGVDLFFVLSGFLIVGILLDNRGADNFFRVFYLRRVCRIFPLYFLLLLLFLIVPSLQVPTVSRAWLFDNPMPVWSYAMFVQNFFMGHSGSFGAHWLGVTWSLAVEEQFYLLVPALVFFLTRRSLFSLFCAFAIGAVLLRIAFPGFMAFVGTPWRADGLFSGGILAILVRHEPLMRVIRGHRSTIVFLLVVLSVGLLVMLQHPKRFGPLNHLWLSGLYSLLLLAVYTESSRVLTRIFESSALVALGKISYGLYMYHQAVSGLMHGWLRGAVPAIICWTDLGVTLLSFVAVLSISFLSYKYFEQPILKFGRRFFYTSSGGGAETEAVCRRENIR